MFTAQELVEDFTAAWLAGMAPRTALYVDLAAPEDREEVERRIGAWLAHEAPSVVPHPARAAELLADLLVQRLAALESDWWDARDGADGGHA